MSARCWGPWETSCTKLTWLKRPTHAVLAAGMRYGENVEVESGRRSVIGMMLQNQK